MIRLLIVADSPLARAGLESMVRSSPGVEIVGAAGDLRALGELLLDAEADALLIDAAGPNGQSVFDTLAASDFASDLAVIVLSDRSSSLGLAAALRAGVRSVLPREVSAEQLTAAIQAVAAGLVVVTHDEVASSVAESIRAPAHAELAEPLTPREREVLQMMAAGLANKEIAAKLAISEHTVKFHVASILGKLGASTRTEAVSNGIRHGLILL